MHQTFYIDIDEEITSIIDRLRHADAKEAVIVVPKRALLIQSIVNLKLLKKEAQNMGKQIMIVTQDKLGKLLVEKTGILVQQKLDEEDEEVRESVRREEKGKETAGVPEKISSNAGEKRRLDTIGSSEYFEEGEKKDKELRLPPMVEREKNSSPPSDQKIQEEKIINKELVTEAGVDMNKTSKSVLAEVNQSNAMIKNMDIRQADNPDFLGGGERNLSRKKRVSLAEKSLFKKEAITKSEPAEAVPDKLADFFQKPSDNSSIFPLPPKKPAYQEISLSKKFWKSILLFGAVACTVVLLAVAYLFLPEAQVRLFARMKQKSIETDIKGSANFSAVNVGDGQIPLKVIQADEEISRTYTSTGSKSSNSQKSKGVITVYNEYNASPQPLVATTRFLSEDGKIFRLVKSITVPGITQVGGETKPGAIEAEVIADESGDSFNIGPSKFTIPGFQSSGAEKYSKFYGKSSKPMSGGGNGTQSLKTVSSGDIASAKAKILSEITEAVKKKIQDLAGSDMTVLDEAIDIGGSVYTLSDMEGEMAETFTVTVKTKAKALVFRQEDLRGILLALVSKDGNATAEADKDSLKIELGKAQVDMDKGTLELKAEAKAALTPKINMENLKRGILGKDEGSFESYLKTYPEIEKAEVNYWPSFISGKIPSYENRVSVELVGTPAP